MKSQSVMVDVNQIDPKQYVLDYARSRWEDDYWLGRMPYEKAGWFGFFTVPGITIPKLRLLCRELVDTGQLIIHPDNPRLIRIAETHRD